MHAKKIICGLITGICSISAYGSVSQVTSGVVTGHAPVVTLELNVRDDYAGTYSLITVKSHFVDPDGDTEITKDEQDTAVGGFNWYRRYGPDSATPGKVELIKHEHMGTFETDDEHEGDDFWVEKTPHTDSATTEPSVGQLAKSNTVTVPDHPDNQASSIRVDASSYPVEGDMVVTVALKRTNGKIIKAQCPALNDKVIVPGAVANGAWSRNADGTCARHYTATTAGTGLKAVFKWKDTPHSLWSRHPPKSEEYAIVVPAVTSVTANGYTYPADAGFPTNGLNEKRFTLNLNVGNASGYSWQSNVKGIEVRDGVVKLPYNRPENNKITLTGIRHRQKITYSFTLKRWFYGVTTRTWQEANGGCKYHNDSLPSKQKLYITGNKRGSIGTLWSEWELNRQSNYFLWTSEDAGNGQHYVFTPGSEDFTARRDSDSWPHFFCVHEY